MYRARFTKIDAVESARVSELMGMTASLPGPALTGSWVEAPEDLGGA
jgi:hypothetical protein